jgi:pimeloyl-ACP methyl ester carboxylesterase
MARASVRLCDQGELVLLENATHWIQHDEPERLNAMLLDYLKRPVE